MGSMIGEKVKLSVFGESHGTAIGCVLDGLPAGCPVDIDAVAAQMARRAPGKDATATPRRESDAPRILSGLLDGRTTGAPLAMMIENENTRSADYADLARHPRPGHADYPGFVRYEGMNDIRGGGHFSGRLTAPLVFAGAICRQILAEKGIAVGGHIASIGGVHDAPLDPVGVTAGQLNALAGVPFSLVDPAIEDAMRQAVEAARAAGDSVGGVVEVAAVGLPAGWGDPMFGGVENRLAALLFGVPAVKGVEFGDGFDLAARRGSEANDPWRMDNGRVTAASNHNGGILGGITTGMPLIVRAAIKPTPSIAVEQDTVDLQTGENARLCVKGRHDPCIVPRALPVIEAAVAVGLLDLAVGQTGVTGWS
ncbi:MAG: chorismate synthase [Acutalibacteraceae bacterium]|jgi:chorismate synthase